MALEAREAGGKNANKVVLKSVETGTGKRQYQVDISNIKKMWEQKKNHKIYFIKNIYFIKHYLCKDKVCGASTGMVCVSDTDCGAAGRPCVSKVDE